MIDRKQIKSVSKGQISRSSPGTWKVMLLWVLAAVVMPQMVLNFISSPLESMEKLSQLVAGGIDPQLALRALEMSVGQLASAMVLNLVLSIYQMVMGFGLSLYALRLYRGQPCGPSDLFAGFSMVGRVVGQQILVNVILLGCVIAGTIPITMVGIYAAIEPVTGSVLLVLAGVVVIAVLVSVMLSFALASTALADQPELGAMGSIQYGKNLIRGHKGQFAVLLLSFFGWALLCALPVGIFTVIYTVYSLPLPVWIVYLIDTMLLLPCYLWLVPYAQTAAAGFYDALRQGSEIPQMPPL